MASGVLDPLRPGRTETGPILGIANWALIETQVNEPRASLNLSAPVALAIQAGLAFREFCCKIGLACVTKSRSQAWGSYEWSEGR